MLVPFAPGGTDWIKGPRDLDFSLKASAAVAELVGKPEKFVMVLVEAGGTMSFGGTHEPAAFLQLISLGKIGGEINKGITRALSDLMAEAFGVPADRLYLHFIDPARSDFGWNGTTFG